MDVVKGYQKFSHPVHRPVVTIGNFDGVHLGHQRIIRLALSKAREQNGVCIAYTFRPHPQIALRPGSDLPLLSTYEEKLEILQSLGVDIAIEEPFSREFSSIESEVFFKEVICQRLGARVIVVGYDFAFGSQRSGHLDNLKKWCRSLNVDLEIVPPHEVQGEVVSSSKIRKLLLEGEVDHAKNLLGRPFSYRGVIVKGEGRGRKLGFPTANLKLEEKLRLPYGVYSTRSKTAGKIFPSVTNIGIRPTFSEKGSENLPLVETHLIGTVIDLYGAPFEVEFVAKLRDEKRFSSIEDLKSQIRLDLLESLKFNS